MLLCIEYGILFVDTVDTKIKACNALNAMFVETVDTTIKTHPHILAHNFLNIQWIFNPQKVLESWDSGLFNHTIYTIYVDTVNTRQGSLMHSMHIYVDTVDTKHVHTFLPITFLIFKRIFSLQKVLESWDSGLFKHTINTIYVDTVNTRQGSLMDSMLSMSTLSIQFSHLIVLCIRCCVRITNTSVDSVDKHSIKCIACFDLHIDSVNKQDTLLNTQ